MILAAASDNITTLVIIVIGSGTGGIFGAFFTLKKYQLEKKQAVDNRAVSLRTVDVDQFKAMFPGGLGDAVEHWRDEAKGLYVEVDELRKQRQADHDQIMSLQAQLTATQAELTATKRELSIAQDRITHLESA